MTTKRLPVPCSEQVLPELTETEKSCLTMIAEGMGADATAQVLDLPRARVDLVLNAAQEKLGAQNVLHAVSKALLTGTIAKDDIPMTE
ncbi:LuxR C-terminal-related transcriptional regulator [Peteryoungia ipomoeae]|uniref:LuxR family transcriptional regulator n=1 Tax=Peteryoungia ipomoeae TaxID=1210932 RepID=A0A4S8P251_9HYPH|nr:LuxR C-terminal-related transcriptional regulator [Peteryoungia ipomoeae]THV24130.1 LuxR family transcriptional regulator [Peteryoungia ipomoeae]